MAGFKIPDCWSTKETEKAVLVQTEMETEPIWIPKSQIHDDSEVWKGDQEGDLVVSEWYAEKKSWL